MDKQAFQESLSQAEPPALSAHLQALWWDAKGEWDKAHDCCQDEYTETNRVHAYLHRKEGDAGNAGYWYRRAGAEVFQGTLEAEWAYLVEQFPA